MRTHIAIIIASAALIFTACSHKDEGKVAANAAKLYYENLIAGKYNDFVDGIYRPAQIPETYRTQLIESAKMFVRQLETEHRGVREIRVSNGVLDSTSTSASAYLVLCFGDSTSEEMLVPMVKHDDLWLMK